MSRGADAKRWTSNISAITVIAVKVSTPRKHRSQPTGERWLVRRDLLDGSHQPFDALSRVVDFLEKIVEHGGIDSIDIHKEPDTLRPLPTDDL